MGKFKITIKISRYQKDKILGERYRNESQGNESFNDWKRKTLENEKRKKHKY